MIRTAFSVFLTSWAISLACVYVICHVAAKIGFLDRPGGRKRHTKSVPLGGGLAIFLGTAIPVLIGVLLSQSYIPRLPDFLAEYASKLPLLFPQLMILWCAGFVIMLVGLLDDMFGLSPYLRLAVQVGTAILVYVLSYMVTDIPEDMKLGAPVFRDMPWLQGIFTVLWIVGLINAFNFLDNMDGMCAGVAIVSSAVLLTVAVQTQQIMVAAMLVTFIGALFGFMWFNFPPARIFMGDAGSTFVGFFMAIMTMAVTFFEPETSIPPLTAALIPVLVLIVPIYDICSVVFIRLKEHRSPFKPDRRHFSHRLLALGMSQTEVLVTVYMVVFAIGIAATLLPQLTQWGQVMIVVQGGVILSLISLLENAGRRQKRGD